MKTAIQHLIELQSIDQKLDKIERDKGDLPARVETLKKQRDRCEQALKDAQEHLQALQVQRRQLELEAKTLQENRAKFEEQLYAVQTNKEYDAVTLEIETAISKIDELDTQQITLMEEEDQARETVGTCETELKESTESLQQKSERLEQTIARNAEKEKALREQRASVAGEVKPRFMRLYDKIRGPKGGHPVVPVSRNSCGGCFTQIPPQRIMEIREAQNLFTCEHCGRILYWRPEEQEAATA